MNYTCENAIAFVTKYPQVIKDDYKNYFEWLYEAIRDVNITEPSVSQWIDKASSDLTETVFQTFNNPIIARNKICSDDPGTLKFRHGTPPILYVYKDKWEYKEWEECASNNNAHNTLKLGVGVYFHSLVDLWYIDETNWDEVEPESFNRVHIQRIRDNLTKGNPRTNIMGDLYRPPSTDNAENWEVYGYTLETYKSFQLLPVEVRRMVMQTWIFHPEIRDPECMLLDPLAYSIIPDPLVQEPKKDDTSDELYREIFGKTSMFGKGPKNVL